MPPHNSPWTITERAARDLLRITGRGSAQLSDALAELRTYIAGVLERDTQPRTLASGLLQYRAGRPLRPRLIVDPQTHPPTLVECRADHEGRTKPYTRTRSGGHAGDGAQTLRDLREDCGVEQTELAARMGSTQATVSRLESSPNPPLDTLRAAIEALGGKLELRARIDGDVVLLKFPKKVG